MQKAKHTPGPWRVWDILNQPEVITDRRTAYETDSIAQLSMAKGREQALANGRLIAAAPELLEKLEYFTTFVELNDNGDDEDFTAMLESARAIIAKASAT